MTTQPFTVTAKAAHLLVALFFPHCPHRSRRYRPSGFTEALGVAFDPDFATNRFVYIYYTATTPAIHNRISRFTANGDVAAAGSEVIIFELNNLSSVANHNRGALAFGPDGSCTPPLEKTPMARTPSR